MLRGGPGAAPVFTCRVELSHWDQPANAKILRCLIFVVLTQLMPALVEHNSDLSNLSKAGIKKEIRSNCVQLKNIKLKKSCNYSPELSIGGSTSRKLASYINLDFSPSEVKCLSTAGQKVA